MDNTQNPNPMNQQNAAAPQHKSRLGLLLVLVIVAALLVVLMSVFGGKTVEAPVEEARTETATTADDSASIQAELDALEFEGLSEGI